MHNISSSKNTRSNDKISRKIFFRINSIRTSKSIPKKSTDFRNIHNIENKLTRFQINQETEIACKYRNPLYKTQYSEILVEYEKCFDMTTGKKNLILMPQVTL